MEKAIDLLEAASMLQAAEARAFALHHLDTHKGELTSIQKLELSKRYSFPASWAPNGPPPVEPNWIPEAVEDLLLYREASRFTVQDIHAIGDLAFLVIFKARLALEQERRFLAFRPPTVNDIGPSFGCNEQRHKGCKRTWIKVWLKEILPSILHPVSPLPFSSLKARAGYLSLQPSDSSDQMNLNCREQFVRQIPGPDAGRSNMPAGVRSIIRTAATTIYSWYQIL
jgi:hypothetical protein